MRNLCSILSALLFVIFAPLTWAKSPRKSSLQPDRGTQHYCQRQLQATTYDSYGNEQPGYSNSYEQDRRRFEPGPDEVDDRNPDESDAYDPGGF